MELSLDQLDQIVADPSVQHALQAWNAYGKNAETGRGHSVHPNEIAAQQAAMAAGMPGDYYLTFDGQIKPKYGLKPWLKAAAMFGAGVAGAGALGAFGGAGAGAANAAGAGGVGLGETGAVTGLGGSGFGAGGGLGYAAAPTVAATSGIGSKLVDAGLKAAVPAGLAVAGRVAGRGGGGQIPPELRQILDLQRQRLQMQGPLYESILRLAQSRLPMSARSGPSLLPQTNPADALARLAGASPRGV